MLKMWDRAETPQNEYVARVIASNPKCQGCLHYETHKSACLVNLMPQSCGAGEEPHLGYAPLSQLKPGSPHVGPTVGAAQAVAGYQGPANNQGMEKMPLEFFGDEAPQLAALIDSQVQALMAKSEHECALHSFGPMTGTVNPSLAHLSNLTCTCTYEVTEKFVKSFYSSLAPRFQYGYTMEAVAALMDAQIDHLLEKAGRGPGARGGAVAYYAESGKPVYASQVKRRAAQAGTMAQNWHENAERTGNAEDHARAARHAHQAAFYHHHAGDHSAAHAAMAWGQHHMQQYQKKNHKSNTTKWVDSNHKHVSKLLSSAKPPKITPSYRATLKQVKGKKVKKSFTDLDFSKGKKGAKKAGTVTIGSEGYVPPHEPPMAPPPRPGERVGEPGGPMATMRVPKTPSAAGGQQVATRKSFSDLFKGKEKPHYKAHPKPHAVITIDDWNRTPDAHRKVDKHGVHHVLGRTAQGNVFVPVNIKEYDQSSQPHRTSKKALTGEQIDALLAKAERTPEESKALRKSMYGDDWLCQFQGTPYFAAAAKLCERDLEIEEKRLKRREEQEDAPRPPDKKMENLWLQQDRVSHEKRKLMLKLARHRNDRSKKVDAALAVKSLEKAFAPTLKKQVISSAHAPKGTKLPHGSVTGVATAAGRGGQGAAETVLTHVPKMPGKGKAELTTRGRKKIKKENFALPGGRYPIHDAAHARNALARVSQHGTAEEQKKVRAAVARKYPGIGKAGGKCMDGKAAGSC